MADAKKKLTRKQEEAIIALLSNRNIEEAARACNTPPKTLHRLAKGTRLRCRLSGSSAASLWTVNRAFTTRFSRGSDYTAQSDARYSDSALHARQGGRQRAEPCGESHRDRRYRGARGGIGTSGGKRKVRTMRSIDGRVAKLEQRFLVSSEHDVPCALLIMNGPTCPFPELVDDDPCTQAVHQDPNYRSRGQMFKRIEYGVIPSDVNGKTAQFLLERGWVGQNNRCSQPHRAISLVRAFFRQLPSLKIRS
jgi:hypothetical protein